MAGSSCTADTASNSGLSKISDKLLRIVMVGKTGAGKSATGNTILGQKYFESKPSATSLTVHCSKGRTEVDGQKVAVIDTPGLFDTRFDKDETAQHLSQCITFAAPGPHVFLVVISLVDRYTEEEKQTVQNIQEIFGDAADKYSMILFTHGDQLKGTTIEEFLDGSPDLQELVARCNGQYHAFNNELEDRSQVIELLQKIRQICRKNPGSYYTNEMFQQAEREVEEKKQEILKESEEQMRRDKEELERAVKKKYEMELKEYSANAEMKAKLEIKRRTELMDKEKVLQERHETEARVKAEESNLTQFFRKEVKNAYV